MPQTSYTRTRLTVLSPKPRGLWPRLVSRLHSTGPVSGDGCPDLLLQATRARPLCPGSAIPTGATSCPYSSDAHSPARHCHPPVVLGFFPSRWDPERASCIWAPCRQILTNNCIQSNIYICFPTGSRVDVSNLGWPGCSLTRSPPSTQRSSPGHPSGLPDRRQSLLNSGLGPSLSSNKGNWSIPREPLAGAGHWSGFQ